jgi:hypothetical protein
MFEASGKTVAEFADMYGMDPDEVSATLERARLAQAAQAAAAAKASEPVAAQAPAEAVPAEAAPAGEAGETPQDAPPAP